MHVCSKSCWIRQKETSSRAFKSLGVFNLFTKFSFLDIFFVLLYVDFMQFRKKQDISPNHLQITAFNSDSRLKK